MKRKKVLPENYLEKTPIRNADIVFDLIDDGSTDQSGKIWKADESGAVTLEIENKGVFNKIAQKLLNKPKVSYIHLDELGSFVWQITDGEKTIVDIGKEVEERFGDAANPLYERLAEYFRILDSYGFVKL